MPVIKRKQVKKEEPKKAEAPKELILNIKDAKGDTLNKDHTSLVIE